MITFDDGYSDIVHTATPVLERLKFKAVNFVITDRIGKQGYLYWKTVAEIQNSTIWETHYHSHTHSRWQSRESVFEDLKKSGSLLAEHLNKEENDFDTLAWP